MIPPNSFLPPERLDNEWPNHSPLILYMYYFNRIVVRYGEVLMTFECDVWTNALDPKGWKSVGRLPGALPTDAHWPYRLVERGEAVGR